MHKFLEIHNGAVLDAKVNKWLEEICSQAGETANATTSKKRKRSMESFSLPSGLEKTLGAFLRNLEERSSEKDYEQDTDPSDESSLPRYDDEGNGGATVAILKKTKRQRLDSVSRNPTCGADIVSDVSSDTGSEEENEEELSEEVITMIASAVAMVMFKIIKRRKAKRAAALGGQSSLSDVTLATQHFFRFLAKEISQPSIKQQIKCLEHLRGEGVGRMWLHSDDNVRRCLVEKWVAGDVTEGVVA